MRTTRLEINYESKDITEAIEPCDISLEYTDQSHGKSDSLSLTVADTDGRWKADWYPEKGAKLEAKIITEVDGTTAQLHCGIFEIDEIEAAGPPQTVSIKATSVKISKSLKSEKKTAAWESLTLEEIAGKIAAAHGMGLFYEAGEIKFERLDQKEETDLKFLTRLCSDNGFNLKVAEEKLVIFEGKKFEQKDASFTIRREDTRLKSWRFTDKAHEVFTSCQVNYRDPATKADKLFLFIPENGPAVGEKLVINARVESLAQAERKAKAELRRKNKGECKGTLETIGHVGFVAGLNVALEDFGQFDGKYFIDEANHRVDKSSGYTTSLSIRKVLDY